MRLQYQLEPQHNEQSLQEPQLGTKSRDYEGKTVVGNGGRRRPPLKPLD